MSETRGDLLIRLADKIESEHGMDKKSITVMGHKPVGKCIPYGEIYHMTIPLNVGKEEILVTVPGYSPDSFEKMSDIIISQLDILKPHYASIMMICWNDEVKTMTKDIDYDAHELIRIELAKCLNIVLDKMEVKECSILGKSAGGGVTTHLAATRDNVHKVFLVCPGTNNVGKPLESKDFPIKIMWNKDDNKLPYSTVYGFLEEFDRQKKNTHFIHTMKVVMKFTLNL